MILTKEEAEMGAAPNIPGDSQGAELLHELKRAGLKLTPQRVAIVREIASDTTHPTAQELFERLRPSFHTMSFATVYNTLDALAKLGLVRSLRLGGRDGATTRFDPNTSSHHHAVCDRCGGVLDVPAAESLERLPAALTSSGFEVRAEERTYRGHCADCAADART